jgi:peroxiredoxin Q/BCP
MKTIISLLMIFFLSFVLQAQLDVGDKVSDFSAKDAQGNDWQLKDHLGKKTLVVYFFPVAFTGGCTKQACAYRDKKDDLEEVDAEVIGISGDQPENLKYFAAEHDLTFTLLSDADGKVAELFGVPVGKGGMMKQEIDGETVTLKRGVTAARWTFVLDKEGVVLYKNDSVNPTTDTDDILSFLKKKSKD